MSTNLVKCFRSTLSRSFWEAILGDIFLVYRANLSSSESLRLAMKWLCRAQDITGCGGISAWYNLMTGWAASYPETTGYVIPTFIDYFHFTGDREFLERALRMADWECDVQLPCGGVQSGHLGYSATEPAVFNTGQVLLGWCSAYAEVREDCYLQAAIKAARWLCSMQDEDGCWRRGLSTTAQQTPHTYNVRAAWALLCLYRLLGDKEFLQSAQENLDWTLRQQTENGWFRWACPRDNKRPTTHGLGYILNGLILCGSELQDERCLGAARTIADRFVLLQSHEGALAGRYDHNWWPAARWICITGIAQITLAWLRLFEQYRRPEYVQAANHALMFLRKRQVFIPTNMDLHGGLWGSQPIYGEYFKFQMPNWGVKFYVDLLMLDGQRADIRQDYIEKSKSKKQQS